MDWADGPTLVGSFKDLKLPFHVELHYTIQASLLTMAPGNTKWEKSSSLDTSRVKLECPILESEGYTIRF